MRQLVRAKIKNVSSYLKPVAISSVTVLAQNNHALYLHCQQLSNFYKVEIGAFSFRVAKCAAKQVLQHSVCADSDYRMYSAFVLALEESLERQLLYIAFVLLYFFVTLLSLF